MLENADMTNFAKKEMKDQNSGYCLRLTELCGSLISSFEKRGMVFSDGLLLSSYDRSERQN